MTGVSLYHYIMFLKPTARHRRGHERPFLLTPHKMRAKKCLGLHRAKARETRLRIPREKIRYPGIIIFWAFLNLWKKVLPSEIPEFKPWKNRWLIFTNPTYLEKPIKGWEKYLNGLRIKNDASRKSDTSRKPHGLLSKLQDCWYLEIVEKFGLRFGRIPWDKHTLIKKCIAWAWNAKPWMVETHVFWKTANTRVSNSA